MPALSAHFHSRELQCQHCKRLPVFNADLVARLERLRKIVGKPLPIVSGYRCPVANANVGGTWDSEHLVGNAVDIPSTYCTVTQAKAAGFIGIGTRRGRPVHLDMRRKPGDPFTYGKQVVFKED